MLLLEQELLLKHALLKDLLQLNLDLLRQWLVLPGDGLSILIEVCISKLSRILLGISCVLEKFDYLLSRKVVSKAADLTSLQR